MSSQIGGELENCAAAKALAEVTTSHVQRITAVETKVDEIKSDLKEVLVILHTVKLGAKFMHRSFFTVGSIILFAGKLAAAIAALLGLSLLLQQFRNSP